MSRLLTEEHKKKHSSATLEFLTLYREQGDDPVKCVVTGDEMWIYHYTTETKCQSMTRMQPGERALKKAKVEFSARKAMVIVFWDWQRMVSF